MKCQDCGAENLDGSVFCTYCKSRIVVSESDAPVPLPDIDRPYFSVQFFGETSSYDVGGFSLRFIALPVIAGAVCLLFWLVVAGWISALTVLIWIGAYFSLVYVALVLYKSTKRPIDLGGAGVSPLPSVREAEQIESDHHEMKRTD